MDQRRFGVLFARLCAIGAKVERLTIQNATMKSMWYGPRGFFLLSPDATKDYWQLVADILRYADWEQKFSPDYITDRLRRVVEDYHLSGEAVARSVFQDLTDQLAAFNDPHTVYLPLLGVTLENESCRELGGIILHKATDEFLNSITRPETTAYIKRQTETLVWAETTIVAEPRRAASRAEEACQPVIDVLRFWMACITKSGTACAIGLQGDIITAERPRIIVGTRATYDPHRSRLIPGFPLTEHTIRVLQKARVHSLAHLLATDVSKRSKFAKLLLHALHVFGNATAAALPTDRFMNLMTTLEAFLTVGDGPITQSVAEGVVIFLDVPVTERLRLKKELQRLYRLRSKLAHGEQTSIPRNDLCLLEDLTKSFLGAMIQHRDQFASKEALLGALEARRLA